VQEMKLRRRRTPPIVQVRRVTSLVCRPFVVGHFRRRFVRLLEPWRRGLGAVRLSLSPATVRNYLSNAIGKVGGRNRIDAIRIARDAGWL
jgi:hypothetical protein